MPRLVPPAVRARSVGNQPQPALDAGEGCILRPFRPSDADALVAAYSDPDIEFFHFRTVDADEADAWIAGAHLDWTDERAATWAITDDSEQAVGRMTVYLSLEKGQAEVSYWVLPSARGRGLATRACRRATLWAHAIGIERVELRHAVVNVGSGVVARRSGFEFEGVLRAACRLADGWHDMAVYSCLRSDGPKPRHETSSRVRPTAEAMPDGLTSPADAR